MATLEDIVPKLHEEPCKAADNENDIEEAKVANKGQAQAEQELPAAARPEWALWKLALMALPQLGVQVLWCFIGPNAAPYMLHLGMGASLATLNNVAGPITGFFTGPLVGAWSDRCTSRFGRRRPIILAGLLATWIAGLLFASAEYLFSGSAKILFAAPMYWVLDVTINVLQTPHRALVADLASERQQVPMQVWFVFMMAVGNMIGFSIMQIWAVPVEHMLELMVIIVAINTVCIGIQFLVAKEEPFSLPADAPKESVCAPVLNIVRSVRGMPRLLYHLAAVQCFVWVGNTAWNYYGSQWFANAVFQGDQEAPEGSAEKIAYGEGMHAFSTGGQFRSVVQLLSALVIITILLKTTLRPRLIYAPTIFFGAAISLIAAFAVGHNGALAIFCMAASVMPETGSFAIPFGLVATLNKRAEAEGKQVSTALQMALLNCCVTVGQQICHISLSTIEGQLELEQALPLVFLVAGATYVVGGAGACCLDDRPHESPVTA